MWSQIARKPLQIVSAYAGGSRKGGGRRIEVDGRCDWETQAHAYAPGILDCSLSRFLPRNTVACTMLLPTNVNCGLSFP